MKKTTLRASIAMLFIGSATAMAADPGAVPNKAGDKVPPAVRPTDVDPPMGTPNTVPPAVGRPADIDPPMGPRDDMEVPRNQKPGEVMRGEPVPDVPPPKPLPKEDKAKQSLPRPSY